ncbi:MAG: sigma-70 family RNA polymerase sigma factor [Gemmatimonadetes bacterium]|jgi:RNA polymerase sigma factor (sigma-70 family)|nr:sigma-70 family RNA polymerase sigma factor [Gemmatimonadota bacterium]
MTVEHKSDVELVVLARRGNRRAFGELVTRHYDMAVRLSMRMVRDEECARELVQEAALQGLLSLDRLQDDSLFGSWFCGIALNLSRSYLRLRKAEFPSWESLVGGLFPMEEVLVDPEPGPEESLEVRGAHRQVLGAVEELSPKLRRATLLFYFEQLSLREIAALLDCSVGAVKGRLHKARKELRERLWPLYAQDYPAMERKNEMTKVEIADVIDQDGKSFLIFLLDRENRRCIPITIGVFEGNCLAMGLRGISTPRPVTAQFAANILEAVGAELEEVRIEKLEKDIFYAVAKVRSGDEVRELDARPSDAMGVAVLAGSPIYVTDQVWEKCGRELSDEEMAQLGHGLEQMAEAYDKKVVEQKAQAKFVAEAEEPEEDAVLVCIELGRGKAEAEELEVGGVLAMNKKTGEAALLRIDGEPRFIGGVVFTGSQSGLKVGRITQEQDVEEDGEKNVSFEMGRGWLTGEKAGDIGGGSLVLVEKMAGEPIDVLIDGELVGRGVVVVVEDQLGVRVGELI